MADWDTSAALGGHLRNQNATAEKKPKNEHRWIWFVTGPTACGKTTVAKALARELEFTYVEGDDVSFFFSYSFKSARGWERVQLGCRGDGKGHRAWRWLLCA